MSGGIMSGGIMSWIRLRRLGTSRPYCKILDPPLTLSNVNGDISQKDIKFG